MRHVYVIGTEDGSRHKVGVSRDPAQRLAYLQPGSAARLRLVQSWERDDAYQVERAAHRALIHAAVHGEWFAVPEAEAVAAVARIIAGPLPRSARGRRPHAAPAAARKTWDEIYAEEVAQHGEAAVLAAVEGFGAQVAEWRAANDASTLHKHFPGGTTATVHDPVTCEVRGE